MNDNNDNGFKFVYSAPTATERREVESIRKDYVEKSESENKLDKLRSLDKKVKQIPKTVSIIIGVFGILIFGLGLSIALSWNLLVKGIIIAAVGAAVMAIAYPIYKKLFKYFKQRHGAEIIRLSDEILQDTKKE